LVHIRVEGITKRFGEKKVLDNVTLEADEQSFTCIFGPPGAGKTTLLRIICGLERPDKGEIYIDEKNVTDLPPKDRGIRMVFQTFALYPHMKVYDNIASPLKLIRLRKEDIDERVREVAHLLSIDHLLDRFPDQLSGGEAQRVAIARAIAKRADVYLFDEPLTNLDYKIRSDMRVEFRKMKEELGQTIIYATPDPMDVLSMADKVTIINNGRIEQSDELSKVYKSPANVFVAKYLGYPAINIVDCHLQKEEKLFLDANYFKVDITSLKNLVANKASGDELLLGLRPSKLSISESKPEADVIVKGEVVECEVLGSTTLVYVKVGKHIIRVFRYGIEKIDVGKNVWISYSLEDIHIFDRKTGKTII